MTEHAASVGATALWGPIAGHTAAASEAFATAVRANLNAQRVAADKLRGPLKTSDSVAARAAVDAMTAAFETMYRALQPCERAWNDLALAAAGE